MKSRRKARETALQALYQCDSRGDWSKEAVEMFFEAFVNQYAEAPPPANGNSNDEFARTLIFGAMDNVSFLDKQIGLASTHWSLPRMARVDRNILRLASFEMAFMSEIPISVSINEAIEIAKRFGSDDSPKFVNGVLDNVARVFNESPDLLNQKAPDKKAVNS